MVQTETEEKMKRIVKCTTAVITLVAVTVTTVLSGIVTKADDSSITQLMDCFQPMPIVENLTTNCWGSVVGARDQGNGIEDRENDQYCYWDGKILKDEDTGIYYMFASRWNESNGHNGWFGSNAVYATSNNLYGPYTDRGLMWPNDQGGKGHNVWPVKLHDGDPNGKYAIVVSETRGGDVFVSDSLAGPWRNAGVLKVNEGYWHSNTCLIARPDGKYEIINRTGDIAISDTLFGNYEVQTRNIWGQVRGMPTECIEDAVVWYSDGLYHCTVNKWDARNAYYLTSEDGVTDWRIMPGSAYQPDEDFLRYTDGTVNHWNKIERPNVYIEDGVVKAVTFSVIDVPKDAEHGYDSHGSKVIVVPFDGEGLHKFAKEQRANAKEPTQGETVIADTTAQFWNDDHLLNLGGRKYLQVQRRTDEQYGLFGEDLTVDKDRWADSKIAYLKFDISDYDLDEMGKAILSLVYIDKFAGSSKTNRIMVTLADSNWVEGTGTGNAGEGLENGSLTWDNKPALDYDPDDLEGTVAYSDEFATELSTDLGQEINIDVTELLYRLPAGETTVTFAICEEKGNERLGLGSKESGVNAPLLAILPPVVETPAPTPTAEPTPQTVNPTQVPQVTETPDAPQSSVLGKTKVKAKALKNGKVNVSWKKVKEANGYQVLVATKKNGKYKTVATLKKASKTKTTIKKLKAGKTYFVKVRAYKVVNGTKVKGKLSKAVKVKVKK